MNQVEMEELEENRAARRERWISDAVVKLGAGKGHMGIIAYLRDQKMSPELAKKISYDIFDEAKRRLMRSQLGYRIVGWGLILLGVLLPVGLLLMHSRIIVFSGLPLIGGMILLSKLVNPSRLP